MRRLASRIAAWPAVVQGQSALQQAANTNNTLRAVVDTFNASSCTPDVQHSIIQQLAECSLWSQMPSLLPPMQHSAGAGRTIRIMHTSSAPSSTGNEGNAHEQTPAAVEKQQEGPGKKSSRSVSHHINPINFDELLQSQPAAIHGSSSNSNSNSSSAQLTEQLLSELFDAELEQRLLAAAAAAHSTAAAPAADNSPAAAKTEASSVPESAAAAAAAAEGLAGTAGPAAAGSFSAQPSAVEQVHHQPGVTAAPPAAPRWQQQSSSSSSSSSSRSSSSTGPARVSSWHPLLTSDPWAPLPSPAAARQRMPGQLLHLLQQAGVPAPAAAAALAAAAADGPAAHHPNSSNSSRALSRKPNKLSKQSQPEYVPVLNRLQHLQLVGLLEDCQAPTYGSKQLLVKRIVLLLQEQRSQQQQQQQQAAAGEQHMSESCTREASYAAGGGFSGGFETWMEGEAGFKLTGDADTADNSGGGGGDMASNSSKKQQRSSSSFLSEQVLAAAAARQQLLDAVLADVGQVGSWLMAARAQDVCIVDVRGRAGLHQQLVIASGLSQRHAHACAEAVAWQIKEKAKSLLLQQQQQQQDPQQQQQQQQLASIEQQLPPLNVLGDASSDWAVLDAGGVVVHVLTERARRFYNLEGLWGGPQGRFIRWLKPEQVVETKDTIGRDTGRPERAHS